jgi:hypothetical protein
MKPCVAAGCKGRVLPRSRVASHDRPADGEQGLGGRALGEPLLELIDQRPAAGPAPPPRRKAAASPPSAPPGASWAARARTAWPLSPVSSPADRTGSALTAPPRSG